MPDIHSFSPLWGTWYITRQLGSGTFGDVYEAKRTDTGKEYLAAIKHISIPPKGASMRSLEADGIVTDEASARRYCRDLLDTLTKEIDICYALKGHTNFVSYEDHMIVPRQNEIGYDVFIRMELLTGLTDYITEHGITVGGITKLCEDMCSALSVLEQKRIIHRDIKPANIFVSESGDFKLGDFGVARHMEGLGSMSIKGTYNYMAPEILKGGTSGANSDIYSLGLVLYRLLNHNRAPFLPPPPAQISYDEDQAALDRRLNGEQLPPPDRAELSLSLTNVIMRACEYAPEHRFQSAAEMKSALRDFRESQRLPAGFDPDATVAVERSSAAGIAAGGNAPVWNKPGYGMAQSSVPPAGFYVGGSGAETQFGSAPHGNGASFTQGQNSNKGIIAALIAIIGVVVVALLAVVIVLISTRDNDKVPSDALSNSDSQSVISTASPDSEPVYTPEPEPAVDIYEIEDIISRYTSAYNVAVSVCDLSTGELYSTEYAEQSFVAAGFYIPIYLASSYSGAGSDYSTSMYDMMTKQDNASANTMIDRIGGFSAVNATLADMGYYSTRFERAFGDTSASNSGYENYTTAEEAARMLKEVYDMGANTMMSLDLKSEGISVPAVDDYYAHRGQGIGNSYNVFVIVEDGSVSFAASILTKDTGSTSAATLANSKPIISDILFNIHRQLENKG